MRLQFKLLLFFSLLCISLSVRATQYSDNIISLDLIQVNLQEAIHLLGKLNHYNLVINPDITGTITLHLHHTSAQYAFDSLLAAHRLSKWQEGNTWFITTLTDAMQRKKEEKQLQLLSEETETVETRLWQIHYAKAEEIRHLLADKNETFLSKRGHAAADERTNSLCVQDTPSHLILIQRLIRQWDTPVQQILIEARLVSVDSDYEHELGVNFSSEQPEALSSGNIAHSKAQYSVALVRLGNKSLLDIQISALESKGHGELISSPSLFTANQQQASIESGEEIPYQEVSKSGATGVSFKKAVLSLRVTPQMLPGDHILLQLQVNQDRPSNRLVLGVPAITTRQLSTNIIVRDGQTVVLGGIYESNNEHNRQQIPYLGKIPLVGWLFRKENVLESKRELLIFVTPKMIMQL